MLFRLFRYGLMPSAMFCVVVIVAGIHIVATTSIRKFTWPQTVVTVTQSQDLGQALSEFRGTPNTFPDPQGTGRYVVDGKSYSWQGHGRELGVTVMKPGDQIKVYYNPANPQQIDSLVLLGLGTGSIILAAAAAFLGFYVWFFWLRRRGPRLAGPHDFESDAPKSSGDAPKSFADRASERISSEIERSRAMPGDRRPVAANNRPTGQTFGQRQGVTFGKR